MLPGFRGKMRLFIMQAAMRAARNIEGGGSLTILATALTETGSKMEKKLMAASFNHSEQGEESPQKCFQYS